MNDRVHSVRWVGAARLVYVDTHAHHPVADEYSHIMQFATDAPPATRSRQIKAAGRSTSQVPSPFPRCPSIVWGPASSPRFGAHRPQRIWAGSGDLRDPLRAKAVVGRWLIELETSYYKGVCGAPMITKPRQKHERLHRSTRHSIDLDSRGSQGSECFLPCFFDYYSSF